MEELLESGSKLGFTNEVEWEWIDYNWSDAYLSRQDSYGNGILARPDVQGGTPARDILISTGCC